MKKIYINIAVLIIVSFTGIIFRYNEKFNTIKVSNSNNINDRLEKVKEKGVLTLASSNTAPYAYINKETEELNGIDGEIIKEIAKRLGINKVELKEVKFADLFNALNTDDSIDIISDGIYVTEDRKKLALFTDPLYKSSEVIVAAKLSRINFKEDLKTAVVGAQNGTLSLNLANRWHEEGLIKEVRVFEDKPTLLQAVNHGNVDAIIADYIVVAYNILTNRTLHLRIIEPYKPEYLEVTAPAVRKSDVTLANAINEKINDMYQDRTIKKIIEKYGGSEKYLINSPSK